MTQNARNQTLAERLAANTQRQLRKTYLNALPSDLSRYLENCEFIIAPDRDNFIPQFLIHPEGVGMPAIGEFPSTITKPPNYQYAEFSWREQLITAAQSRFSDRHDALPALFWPGSNYPIFHVNFGWARQNLTVLLNYKHEESGHQGSLISWHLNQMGLIVQSPAIGLGIDHYTGYVYHDPNPDEIVYELASWEETL